MQYFATEAVTFVVLIAVHSVIAVPLEKKADIATFTSAINAAGRLRYGKRSMPTNWEDVTYTFEDPIYSSSSESQYQYPSYRLIKRALNTDSLVASLNNAERLRFGRR